MFRLTLSNTACCPLSIDNTHCSGCSPSACAAGSTDRPRTSLPNSTPDTGLWSG